MRQLFIAEDGTEFLDRELCLEHEERMALEDKLTVVCFKIGLRDYCEDCQPQSSWDDPRSSINFARVIRSNWKEIEEAVENAG